jgi:hypothetical protein
VSLRTWRCLRRACVSKTGIYVLYIIDIDIDIDLDIDMYTHTHTHTHSSDSGTHVSHKPKSAEILKCQCPGVFNCKFIVKTRLRMLFKQKNKKTWWIGA